MPYFIKSVGIPCHFGRNAMNLDVIIIVKIIRWLNQQGQFLCDYPLLYPNKSDLANTMALSLCSFKIYGREGI